MDLRVGIVTPRYPPNVGGLEEAVEAQAAALAELGHHVEVLTQVNDRRLVAASRPADGPVRVRRYWSVTRSERYPVAPGLFLDLRRRRKWADYDVVHAHHFHSAAALAVLTLPADVPVVYTPHLHGGGHTAGAQLLHRFYGPLSRRLFARADRVVCVSRAEAEVVEAMFPATGAKTEVVHNGLRIRARPPAPYDGSTPPLLLSVGRLEHYKRQDLAVQALAHLPGWELAVVGAGPASDSLKTLAGRLGLGARVHFLGRVSDDELGRWMSRAWAFVSMSEKEAFGLTLLEAAAWGIPVVASDIPAHAEVSGLVPGAMELVATATEPAALAGSIARIAKPMKRVGLRSWVEEFSWAQVGRSLGGIYQTVVKAAPDSRHESHSRATLTHTGR